MLNDDDVRLDLAAHCREHMIGETLLPLIRGFERHRERGVGVVISTEGDWGTMIEWQ